MPDNNIAFYKKYSLICLASINPEILLFPIDNIKTKSQFYNVTYRYSFKNSIRTNGIHSLYKGLSPSITRHWVYSGLRNSII